MASFSFGSGFEEGNASGLGFSITSTSPLSLATGSYALIRSGPTQNVDKSISSASSLRVSWRQLIDLQNPPAYQFVWRTSTADVGKFSVDATGVARWYIGSASVASSNAYQLGLTSIQKAVAHSIDLRISSSGGWIEHWVDGELAFSYSGSTGASPVTTLRHRIDSISYLYVDDYRIDLTDGEASPIGPGQFFYQILRPVDSGTYSNWWGTDGNSASNYKLVNETQADSASYVIASAFDLRDSYVVPSGSFGDDFSVAFIPIAVARKSSTADNSGISIFLRVSGSDFETSGSNALTTSFATYRARFDVNPATGCPWSSSDSGLIEVGIRSSGSF